MLQFKDESSIHSFQNLFCMKAKSVFKKSLTGVALSFIIIAFFAPNAFTAKSADNNIAINKVKTTADFYSPLSDSRTKSVTGTVAVGKQTYSSKSTSVSPGIVIGETWYDLQQNGTMGRMIDWGNDASTGNGFIHNTWMRLPSATSTNRHYAYRYYDATVGGLSDLVNLNGLNDYSGYTQIQSKGNGAAIVGGHLNPNNSDPSDNQSHFYYNFAVGNPFWFESRIPDTVAYYFSELPTQHIIWPKFAYQETPTDTVTHVLAQVYSPASEEIPEALYYFRKVGADDAGSWDYPPYIVDTVNVNGHSIVASRFSDKVAIAWLGRVPAEGDCDTCSNNAEISLLWEQTENDIYYQISGDQGVTWEPRVNATKYHYETGVSSFRANSELSILIDIYDELHLVWTGVLWSDSFENLRLVKAARIFHTSESLLAIGHAPRIVANSDWEVEDSIKCSGGTSEANVAKVQVSECDGKLYVLFVQYNDYPNGVYNDCAERAISEYDGSANGDLYFTVSTDGGVTWDLPRNLTNSRTPGCLPGDCEDDSWPSMARYGRANNGTENWAGAVIVDPSNTFSGAAGEYFLDVQYLSDRDAGAYGSGSDPDGTQQLSQMQWFRLACVEPIPMPQISITPAEVDYIWVRLGEQLDLDLTIVNNGNVGLMYSTSVIEDNGPPGWLSVSGLSGAIPSGLSNVEVGKLTINSGGIITTPEYYYGRIIFISNALSTITLEVSVVVIDTIILPKVDTIAGFLSLHVLSDGSYGHYEPRLGLDYVANGFDCDTTASSYLGEGSPFFLTIDGNDTLITTAAFSTNWLAPGSFKPIRDELSLPSKGSEDSYNWYTTGTFISGDSKLAFEQRFFAPTAIGANYMIKELKVWSYDGLAHSGIRIGDVIDWDIPSDSGDDNLSGIDGMSSRNLIYQVGTEFDTDDIVGNTDCLPSDRRFGGMAFLKSMRNGIDESSVPYSAYTARNDSFIYPTGGLVAGQLWNIIQNSGFWVETDVTDQHMVMCYHPSLSIGADDTVTFYTSLVTVYDGLFTDVGEAADAAKAFAEENDYWSWLINTGCCKGTRGNVDGDPSDNVDISDLVYLVDFIFTGGPAPPCFEEADITGDGFIDISDLVALVGHIFIFGGPFPPC